MKAKLIDRLTEEIKIGHCHEEHNETEWREMAKREYDTYTNDTLKLVACHIIYNEEDNIQKCIEDDMRIVDLDAIYILDGAWEHGGKEINSIDKTKDIIELMKDKISIPIIYETNPTGQLWKSEGDKRNYAFKRIGELYPDRTYAFIKDADETLESNTGRCVNYWLKGSLDKWYPDIALLTAYAYNSSIGGDTPRFFPIGYGIHYYTGKTMIIHNANHEIIVDYNNDHESNPENHKTDVHQLMHMIFNFHSYRIVNNWNIRNKARLKEKHEFDMMRGLQYNTDVRCNCEVSELL